MAKTMKHEGSGSGGGGGGGGGDERGVSGAVAPAMVEARATTALKAATVASFAAGPRRRRRHPRCQRGDMAHCREAPARGMNILHIPRRATGNEPREERGRPRPAQLPQRVCRATPARQGGGRANRGVSR